MLILINLLLKILADVNRDFSLRPALTRRKKPSRLSRENKSRQRHAPGHARGTDVARVTWRHVRTGNAGVLDAMTSVGDGDGRQSVFGSECVCILKARLRIQIATPTPTQTHTRTH